MNCNNVLIISHRRSGTHLTIDTIRNNFTRLRELPYVVLETIDAHHPEHVPVEQMRQSTDENVRVIKTHYRCDGANDLPAESGEYVTQVFAASKKIYVVRNGLDVMASLYEFRRGHDPEVREMSFSQFIREPSFDKQAGDFDKVTYWAHHVEAWLDSPYADDILIVRFEDWVEKYAQTIKRVGKFLDLKSDWRKTDVRIGSAPRKGRADSIERTWVEPRKGNVGDFANYFSKDDLDYFFDKCGDLMTRLGYATV